MRERVLEGLERATRENDESSVLSFFPEGARLKFLMPPIDSSRPQLLSLQAHHVSGAQSRHRQECVESTRPAAWEEVARELEAAAARRKKERKREGGERELSFFRDLPSERTKVVLLKTVRPSKKN